MSLMADESIQERQENELEALKAIYGEQLQEAEKKSSDWQPLDITLTLGPQQGSILQEAHATVDLHIICSDKYPYEIPKMEVLKSKGLTTQQVETLKHNLTRQAERLKGEVMVFELATFVQTFLHQYNKPGFRSLYDEMSSRQKKKQEKEEEQKKVLENKTRQEVQIEIENIREALKQESRWRKNSDVLIEEEENFLTRLDPVQPPPARKPILTADLLDSGDNNETRNMADQGLDDFSPWTASPKGVSRLYNEFEVLQFVGKGAFGDVLKVRNKLDRCLYAIKRIELNPLNKLLYKKLTREVKLLSRLNHENVVRYFNSWIETTNQKDTSSSVPSSNIDKTEELACKAIDMLPMNEVSVEWDLSKRHDSESSEDSSDDNCWITFLPGSSESTSNEDTMSVEELKSNKTPPESRPDSVLSLTQQFMYIQMEFCEKSTLRTAIDDGLYKDEKRAWRLLREIVEGLSHIHQQGIIHRDLKPVNVFIDSEDHVKIGDFGLATTNILPKAGVVVEQSDILASHGLSVGETSHTGQVGTALYVAPELNTNCIKASYNQRVDIYSLGVMFFEMCYHPLTTHMERIKVLADLRLEECILPQDFVDNSNLTKTQLLRWMLNHDPLQRPSSAELLQSELLPPPQFEECELQELLRRTINTPQSKLYKYLIDTCFKQKMTTAQDVTYDMSVSKGRWFISLLQEVVERVLKILKIHGAVSLSPPLLVPVRGSPHSPSAVSVMTRWGGVAMLPHDLRLPFARFLAHNPTITQLKRYAIDRVYRERRVLGHHPRELYECAFDIVTAASGIVIADSELLAFLWEVLSQFPSLLHNNCLMRLSHTNLLRAVLLHCGVEAGQHRRICSLLSQVKGEGYNKAQLLSELELPEHKVCALLSLLDQESTLTRLMATLQPLLRRSSDTNTLCRQACSHLEQVVNNAVELGVKCMIVISPGLVEDLSHYSGLLCQVVWEQRDKQGRSQRTIIAQGGRYDNLISSLRHVPEESQSAAGVSISLDKLVSAMQGTQWKASSVDVVVSSVGSKLIARERLSLIRDLWAAGVKTYLLDSVQNLEEIQNFCQEMNVPHIIMLKDTEPGSVRVRSWNKDRFQERKIAQTECVEYMLRLCQAGETKSEVKSTVTPGIAEVPVVNMVFLVSEKLSSVMKRRYESHIHNSILHTIQRLSAKVKVDVIVVNVEAEVIKMLVSYIQLDSEVQDLTAVIKRFPKHKKIVNRLCEELQELKNDRPAAVVLYSIIDNTFKVLL